MHYIFGLFRPLQIDHVRDHFRPHGSLKVIPEALRLLHSTPIYKPYQGLTLRRPTPVENEIDHLASVVSRPYHLRTGKRGHYERGVFSLEESLESLKSLESLENGRILLCFPQSGSSLESLESLISIESLENGPFCKDPFSKRPLFPNPMTAPWLRVQSRSRMRLRIAALSRFCFVLVLKRF